MTCTGRHLLAALERLRDSDSASLDLPLSVRQRNVTHMIVRKAWLTNEPTTRMCLALLCRDDDPFGRFGLHDLPDMAGELGHYARGR